MKLKDGFVLKQVAGDTVVVPTKTDMNLNMVITLNTTGAFLWKLLEQGAQEQELVDKLLEEYDVDAATARRCVADFVKKVEAHGFLA